MRQPTKEELIALVRDKLDNDLNVKGIYATARAVEHAVRKMHTHVLSMVIQMDMLAEAVQELDERLVAMEGGYDGTKSDSV